MSKRGQDSSAYPRQDTPHWQAVALLVPSKFKFEGGCRKVDEFLLDASGNFPSGFNIGEKCESNFDPDT